MNNKIGEMWNKLFQFKIVKIVKMTYKKGYLHISYILMDEPTDSFEMVIIGYNRVMLLYEEMLKIYPIDDPKIELLGQSGFILLISTLESYLENLFFLYLQFKNGQRY